MSEHITDTCLSQGLLTVTTSAGRRLVCATASLPGAAEGEAVRTVVVAADGHGLLIDGTPLTLTRLRMLCDPGFAAAQQDRALRRSVGA